MADEYEGLNPGPDTPDSVVLEFPGTTLPEGVGLSDFYAYMPTHSYIFAPSREFWPGASVNARIPPQPLLDRSGRPIVEDGKPKKVSASAWLDREKPVEQMTWAPGEPLIVEDRLISEGGWIKRPGCSCFNLYRPPAVAFGDALLAGPWLDHIMRVYPKDSTHIVAWLAHRIQRPEEKINHALVLGGNQGIGKDSILEPVKYGVGPWNFAEVSPQHLLGRFNGFVKSVILRVSEARDLGDIDRFAFYDHMKTYTAAPPDVLRVDEKHLREYSVFNVCGVIITSNHKTDGIYLPADDRRHYVAWSDASRDEFNDEYWSKLYAWYQDGGLRHVVAYLRQYDLSGFNPKSPPPKTESFWAIVDASMDPLHADLADVLEKLNHPEAVTLATLASHADTEFSGWLSDKRNSRKVPHRLEEGGYEPVRNGDAKDGLWKVGGKRAVIYVRKPLSQREKLAAAERIVANTRERT